MSKLRAAKYTRSAPQPLPPTPQEKPREEKTINMEINDRGHENHPSKQTNFIRHFSQDSSKTGLFFGQEGNNVLSTKFLSFFFGQKVSE